jgi:hypothetical protein
VTTIKFELDKRRFYKFLAPLLGFIGVSFLAVLVFPYELVQPAIYDPALNYIISNVLILLGVFCFLVWLFYLGYMIGYQHGVFSNEESPPKI